MITREENDFFTRTGPGTPMGELFRRYWIPALLADELAEPDCPPVRVKLLSEDLVAFRDTLGRIGLVGEFCAHRGVSLWFGRNEENGIRCTYHGWKYDVTGQCVEVPSEPASSGYCARIKLKSYPCVERGGVIWAYMGPSEEQPPAPEFEWVTLPDSHRLVTKRWQESNYLQALEGGIDSSHVSFLHRGDLNTDPFHRDTRGSYYTRKNKHVTFEIIDLPGGLLIGARRDAEPGEYYWRVTQWIMPWYTLIPPYAGDNSLNGHAWVPMDDENCMAWTMTFHPLRPLTSKELDGMRAGGGVHADLIPGSFRARANRENDYLIDRAAQKAGNFYNGVRGLAVQDASVQESMGPIADRSVENLVSTDNAIIMARRRLRNAAIEVQRRGKAPGIDIASQRVRSASAILPASATLKEAITDAIQVKEGVAHAAV